MNKKLFFVQILGGEKLLKFVDTLSCRLGSPNCFYVDEGPYGYCALASRTESSLGHPHPAESLSVKVLRDTRKRSSSTSWSATGFRRPLKTAKSTHDPHKIDNQHRECKTGGGAYFAFFLASDNSHTTPPKIPPDEEGFLWGWCVVGGLLRVSEV